jgi:hypothetical protein
VSRYGEEGSYNESDHYEKVSPQTIGSGKDKKGSIQKSMNNGGSSSQGEEEKQDQY